MKESYADWIALKKDAALEKAQDISKEKDKATISFAGDKEAVVLKYNLVNGIWVKFK